MSGNWKKEMEELDEKIRMMDIGTCIHHKKGKQHYLICKLMSKIAVLNVLEDYYALFKNSEDAVAYIYLEELLAELFSP